MICDGVSVKCWLASCFCVEDEFHVVCGVTGVKYWCASCVFVRETGYTLAILYILQRPPAKKSK